MKAVKHVIVVLAALFVSLGIPALCYVDVSALFGGSVDAVSRASLEIPDQPSGEYVVILNANRFENTKAQWEIFFSDKDAGVIMDDLNCLVIDADVTGGQLAQRYQARLAENQMNIKTESGILVASRAEEGLFDVIVMSREFADGYGLQRFYGAEDGISCIIVRGN